MSEPMRASRVFARPDLLFVDDEAPLIRLPLGPAPPLREPEPALRVVDEDEEQGPARVMVAAPVSVASRAGVVLASAPGALMPEAMAQLESALTPSSRREPAGPARFRLDAESIVPTPARLDLGVGGRRSEDLDDAPLRRPPSRTPPAARPTLGAGGPLPPPGRPPGMRPSAHTPLPQAIRSSALTPVPPGEGDTLERVLGAAQPRGPVSESEARRNLFPSLNDAPKGASLPPLTRAQADHLSGASRAEEPWPRADAVDAYGRPRTSNPPAPLPRSDSFRADPSRVPEPMWASAGEPRRAEPWAEPRTPDSRPGRPPEQPLSRTGAHDPLAPSITPVPLTSKPPIAPLPRAPGRSLEPVDFPRPSSSLPPMGGPALASAPPPAPPVAPAPPAPEPVRVTLSAVALMLVAAVVLTLAGAWALGFSRPDAVQDVLRGLGVEVAAPTAPDVATSAPPAASAPAAPPTAGTTSPPPEATSAAPPPEPVSPRPPPPTPDARTGRIIIDAPDGSTVWVDGKKMGKLPEVREFDLKSGKHRLRVRPPTGRTYDEEILVGADRAIRIEIP